jgi:Ca2+-binding EF-hand superfamily protein
MVRWLAGFSLLLTLTLVLYPALAGDEAHKRTADIVIANFKKLDANSDGRVSKTEFLKIAERFKAKDRAKARDKLSAIYDEIDRDRKGITQEQLKRYFEDHRKKTTEPKKI